MMHSKTTLLFCLALIISAPALWAQGEPVHEQEGKSPGKSIELSVPAKKWLGRELLEGAPGAYRSLIWGHFLVAKAMPANFSGEAEGKYLAEHGLAQFSAVTPREGLKAGQDMFAKSGIQVAMGFPTAQMAEAALALGAEPANPSKVAKGEKPKVAPLEPAYLQASIQLAETLLTPGSDTRFITAFHFHDEPSGEMPYYEIAPDGSPRVARWEEIVKNQFGVGKWGLPKNGWDQSVPESRLAYQKFWAAGYNHYQIQMAQTLRRHKPEIPVWSATFWFNAGSDLLYDFGEMGNFLDALVLDSYASQCEIDAPGRGRWNAGYSTQLLADLGGKPVYNHIQVLEYRDATPSPEDILEYASQTLRGGGAGVIYYAIDFPRYQYIRYRDPKRWDMMMKISDALPKLPRLKRPLGRTGIWVSQETLASEGPRCKENSIYAAHVLLGETLGAPTRFVSDWNLARRGLADLENLKVLHVGHSLYLPKGVGPLLKTWVNQGGVLTLTETASFTRDLSRENAESWQDILGAHGPGTPVEGGTQWALGKGQVLLFQDNPWRMGAWNENTTLARVRALQEKYLGGLDEPHWRFRIPLPD